MAKASASYVLVFNEFESTVKIVHTVPDGISGEHDSGSAGTPVEAIRWARGQGFDFTEPLEQTEPGERVFTAPLVKLIDMADVLPRRVR